MNTSTYIAIVLFATISAAAQAASVPLACSGQWYTSGHQEGPNDALVKVEFDEQGQKLSYLGGNTIAAQALERVSINPQRARGWFGGKANGRLELVLDRTAGRIEIAWNDGSIIYRGKCEKAEQKF